MDATFLRLRMNRWLAEGRTLGLSLRRFHALVVAGGDLEATADVALGIAESQAGQRRVVIGDLTPNNPQFASLVADDDPHGLVDAFDYGISLGRVARPLDTQPNIHLAPTGTVLPEYRELLAHPRWSRLLTAFTDADHLLVVVLPVGTPGMDDLVHQLDGLILVDAMAPARVDTARVLANVVLKPLPLPRLSQVTPPAAPPVPRPVRPAATKPRPNKAAGAPDPTLPRDHAPTRRQTTVIQAFAKPAGYGAGLSILGALILFWLLNLSENEPRSTVPGPLTQVLATEQPTPPPAPVDPNQVNPADSGAAVYAVRMTSANTRAGAILKLQELGPSMPAPTYAPVDKSGQTWYEVLTGAFTTRGGADSLLTSLRSAGRLDSLSPGVVVRVPYAVLIDSVRQSTTISDLLVSLRMRQLPVYAMEQSNGWVWVVAGAFERRAQADSYSEQIRALGLAADVVLRQGRTF